MSDEKKNSVDSDFYTTISKLSEEEMRDRFENPDSAHRTNMKHQTKAIQAYNQRQATRSSIITTSILTVLFSLGFIGSLVVANSKQAANFVFDAFSKLGKQGKKLCNMLFNNNHIVAGISIIGTVLSLSFLLSSFSKRKTYHTDSNKNLSKLQKQDKNNIPVSHTDNITKPQTVVTPTIPS